MFKPISKFKTAAAFTAAFMLASTTFAATSWFDAGIGNYTTWPATGWASSDESTVPVAGMAELSGGEGLKSMVIDTSDAELQYTISPVAELDNVPLIINSTQMFTPAASEAELPDPYGSKGGIAVVKTGESTYAYYGIVADTAVEPMTNAWVALAGAAPTAPATTAVQTRITLWDDNANGKKVTYALVSGDTVTTLTYNSQESSKIVLDGAVLKVAYAGCGTVSALAGDYTVPNYKLTIKNLPNHAVVDKVMVGSVEYSSTEGGYMIPKGSTATIYFKSDDNDHTVAPATVDQVVNKAVEYDATGTITVTATAYAVTYKANGGTGDDDATQKYTVDDAENPVARAVGTEAGEVNFTKAGGLFKTWNTSAEGTGTDVAAGAILSKTSGGQILFAIWTNAVYNVTVTDGTAKLGDDAFETYEISAEARTVTLTFTGTVPAGKSRDGWTVTDGTEVAGDCWTIPANFTGDLTAAPKFKTDVYTLTATGDGSSVSPATYSYSDIDQTATLSASVAAGWQYTWTVDGGSVEENTWTIPAMTTGNLTATRNDSKITYTVIIDENGGTASGTADPTYQISDFAQNVTLTQPTAPSGKEFDAWTLPASPSGLTVEGNTLTIPSSTIGNFTVTATWKDAGGGVVPGGESPEVKADTKEAAEEKVVIKAPDGYSAEQATAYRNLFTKNATQTEAQKLEGKWTVEIKMSDATLLSQTNAVDGVATIVTTNIPVSAVAAGTTTPIAATGLTPGLYYSIKVSNDVSFPSTDGATAEGERAQAATDGKATLKYPATMPTGTAKFFRTHVDAADNK